MKPSLTIPSQGPWLNHLNGLDLHFYTMIEIDGFSGEDDLGDKKFIRILRDICEIVRDAEKRSPPELSEVIETAFNLLEGAFMYAYTGGMFDSQMPCFAYSDEFPLVEDSLKMAGSDMVETFMEFYTVYLNPGAARPKLPAFAKTVSWLKSPRPHPQTTRLSRFRPGVSVSASDTTPRAQLIYQARAQINAQEMSPPCAMTLSADGSILAMADACGYKERDPLLRYFRLDVDCSDSELNGAVMEPGLSNVPRYIATDDERKFIFLADTDRIKSFSWAADEDGKLVRKGLPNVHTMNSERAYTGPLAVLPGGRIVRAGEGRAALWNVDELERHQDVPKGTLIGGSKVNCDNSWREASCEEIEPSIGSAKHTTVAFVDDPKYIPAVWHWHAPTGHLLCGERSRDTNSYACMSIDLEHGGRRVTRFLGHGYDPEKFSTSPGDPNTFWTAGGDGYARMFDVRRPLPVLTFDTGQQSEGCADVVFIHPDGIPTLFTGGKRTQQIKMWDVRARACVYELSTGNNGVTSMLWDERRQTLIAATDSGFGFGTGPANATRKAKIPHWATFRAIMDEVEACKNGTQPSGVVEAGRLGSPKLGKKEGEDEDLEHTLPESDHAEDEDCGEDDVDEEMDEDSKEDDDESGEDDEDDDDDDDDDDDEDKEDEGDEEEDTDDIDEGYSKDKRWRRRSYHNERFFGYAYDASGPVLLRYQFKANPDWDMPPTADAGDYYASGYGW